MSLTDQILDHIAPRNVRCSLCNGEEEMALSGNGLCRACNEKLAACEDIPARGTLDRVLAPYLYAAPADHLIQMFKYSGRADAAYPLALGMAGCIKGAELMDFAVTAVPLHPPRRLSRGFNQAEILARELIKHTGNVYISGLFRRVRNTPHQTGLSEKSRQSNLENAFKLRRKGSAKGLKIILIDDVYTTGATMHECAAVLRASGASRVVALCAAAVQTDKR